LVEVQAQDVDKVVKIGRVVLDRRLRQRRRTKLLGNGVPDAHDLRPSGRIYLTRELFNGHSGYARDHTIV
jgi:hypothetical protein